MQYHGANYSANTWDTYWYEKNLFGDIVAIYNHSGTKLVSYVYDAWGNFTTTYHNGTTSTSVVAKNPFRYRGYYYDADLGLYYLQTRYYDSNTGRFINADGVGYLGENGDINSYNLFAYCSNNPIMFVDPTGHGILTALVIGALVGAAANVAGQFTTDLITSFSKGEWSFSSWETYAGSAIGGAAGGLILAGTGNVGLANFASGLVSTGAEMSLEKLNGKADNSWSEIAFNSLIDGLTSYALGKIPGIKNITRGRNSWQAVYRSGLTKLRHQTASHMSMKVVAKGFGSGFVDGLVAYGYSIIKPFAYNRIKNQILPQRGN